MKKIIFASLIVVSSCTFAPNPAGYYGVSPADQMLSVGQTLIRADQGYRR